MSSSLIYGIDSLKIPTPLLCDSAGNLQIDVVTMPSVTVDITEADDSILCYGNDGGTNRALLTDANGRLQMDVVSALPAGSNNIGDVDVASVPVVGTHNNSASAQTTVGADEFTTAVDCQNTSHLSIFGDVDQATDLEVHVSQDNSNWYQSTHTYSALGAQDFYMDITCGARYVRLNVVQTGTTINCTIAGKN